MLLILFIVYCKFIHILRVLEGEIPIIFEGNPIPFYAPTGGLNLPIEW